MPASKSNWKSLPLTIAGPRVYFALGRDFPAFRALAAVSPKTGAPATALLVQGVVTSLIIVTGRGDQIQQYAGFTLTLFASLAISCVLVLRWRRPDLPRPFRTPGYPLTPLVFVVSYACFLPAIFVERPIESWFGLAVIASGVAYARCSSMTPHRDS